MKLVVQIPCLNEAETLPEVLADIPRVVEGFHSVEVLVVDDGSTDETAAVARAHGADRVLSLRGNRGLAQAFTAGLDAAIAMGADVIVNTDGDHQYPGAEIPRLVQPILAGEADLVIGDRAPGEDPRVPFAKKQFYRLGNFVVRSATGVEVHDAPSGFRAMSRQFALRAYLTNAFSYTLETIFLAGEQRMPVAEVRIRANEKTRPSRLFRGLSQYIRRSAGILLRAWAMHRPLRAFGVIALPFMLLGLGLGLRFLWFFIQDPSYSGHIQSLILAAISTLVGVQIFMFGMVGDLVRTNRLLLQETLLRVRRIELRPRPEEPEDPS